MQKFFIALGIILIAGSFSALEYFLFPNRATPLASETSASLNNTPQNEQVLSSQISEKNFEIAGLSSITRANTNRINHIFGQIRVEASDMAVLKSDFVEPVDSRVLVSIYEIFPLQDTTSTKAFSLIAQKLIAKFTNNLESGINQTNDYGLQSFYFNFGPTPNRAFLLTVTSERLLGFEYQKDDTGRLAPLFSLLAPKRSIEPQNNTENSSALPSISDSE